MNKRRGKHQESRGKPYSAPAKKGKQRVIDERRPRKRDTPTKVVCFRCGEKGDKSNVCVGDVKRCFRCGRKGHTIADCKHDDIVCFNCGEGHISPQSSGNVFALAGTQTSNEDRLIRGTCFINSTPLITTTDTGATHCFIAADCVSKLGLVMSSTNGQMVVKNPAKGSVTTSLVCLKFPLSIFGRDFAVDLVCLPLSGMDVILGMNWLEFNYVHINCFRKMVRFSSFEEEGKTELLTTNQLKQLRRDGIQMFSLMASLSVENQVNLEMAGRNDAAIAAALEAVAQAVGQQPAAANGWSGGDMDCIQEGIPE
ncbi:uncharacterized protein [Medicago truncatula]|uniref:uncharacterized protein n=1 Tax=Medicago truncatula TaxID=3880 RepID=UPI0019672436|nr:uncharacterized protein LOC112419369 [Medicago truncatula]